MPYTLFEYTTISGKSPLKDYLKDLRRKHKTRDLEIVMKYLEKLEEFGKDINDKFSPNAISYIQDKVWELRPLDNRIFYIYMDNKEIVLLHGFYKTTNTTPDSEKRKAMNEMRDYLDRKDKKDVK